MITDYLPLLPEFFLIIMLLCMIFIQYFKGTTTPKSFYTISKYFLFAALLSSVIFYNQSWQGIQINTAFSTLIKSVLFISSLIWFFLSYKWFLNKNIEAFSYYFISGIYILLCSISISTQNIYVLSICFVLFVVLSRFMSKKSYCIEENDYNSRLYIYISMIFIILNLLGIFILKRYGVAASFKDLSVYFLSSKKDFKDVIIILSIIMPWIFLLGIAPFQIPFINMASQTIMPIYGFFTSIPFMSFLFVLINLISVVLKSELPQIQTYMQILSYVSIIWGALGACSEENLRRLFAFSNLFHQGIIILCLSFFSQQGLSAAIIYALVFQTTVLGINATFLGCKSRGEYIINIEGLSGMANIKPYISASFLILIFSLLGNPPLLGYIGLLTVVDNFFASNHVYQVLFILLSLCILAHAYLRILKTLYFTSDKHIFDRIDKGIYIYLFVNLLLIIFTILNPRMIVNNINSLLPSIY